MNTEVDTKVLNDRGLSGFPNILRFGSFPFWIVFTFSLRSAESFLAKNFLAEIEATEDGDYASPSLAS